MNKCPESIEELDLLVEMIPMCRKELYNQAKARIDSGAACSLSEVSRQLGEETGRNPESIRRALQREQEGTATLSQSTQKHRPTIATLFTGDQENYTPEKYIEMSREVMGSIDTDPASNKLAQEIVKAGAWYDKEDDGLEQIWEGNVFLNPPFTTGLIDKFIVKLIEEYKAGNVGQAILLTNNNTDTRWFHFAVNECSCVCFTKGRISFYKEEGVRTSPTNGQAFFYFGKEHDKFAKVFSEIGVIMEVYYD